MTMNDGMMQGRRRMLQAAGAAAAILAVGVLPLAARAQEFDVDAPVYGKALTARELRRGLGIGS